MITESVQANIKHFNNFFEAEFLSAEDYDLLLTLFVPIRNYQNGLNEIISRLIEEARDGFYWSKLNAATKNRLITMAVVSFNGKLSAAYITNKLDNIFSNSTRILREKRLVSGGYSEGAVHYEPIFDNESLNKDLLAYCYPGIFRGQGTVLSTEL